MHVLLLTHCWQPYIHHSKYSGYERIAYYLKDLCDVDVLTWKFGRLNYADDLNVRRVITPPSDVLLERRLILSAAALRYIRDYDVVHALYPIPGLFPSFKGNTIATIHLTSDIEKKGVWWQYHTLLQRIVYKKAVRVITVSTNLKEVLEQKYNVENVVYIPHGVDTAHFCPRPPKNNVKCELLKDHFDFICLTTGIMGTVVEDIYKIAQQFPKVLFMGVGIGKSKRSLSNVILLSGIPEEYLVDLYNVADFFFKPLRFATANNSILEAMSMGKAIVTNAIPGVFDYLDDDSSYLVQSGQEYTDVINQVLENKEERRLRGLHAREKALKEFDWSVVASKVFEVYKSVIG